jgi:hypothetical protein
MPRLVELGLKARPKGFETDCADRCRAPLADTVGLVEKVIAVAQRLLRVLVDRNGDRLDVLVAVAFARGSLAQFGERVDPWRVARLLLVPLQGLCHHQLRPPSTRPCDVT